MNYATFAIPVLLLLPAIGLVAWLCIAMARINTELRNFSSFEEMHFEVGTPERTTSR